MQPSFLLRNIALVNYYFYSQDFRFEDDGNAVVIGNNGTGKSMLLDAIQIVMTGVSRRFLNFNARVTSGNANTRSLRDSCLGKLDDGKGYERRACVTYLALGFESSDGTQRCTAGVCMEARETADDVTVPGLFIVENDILGFSDFVDGTQERHKEKNWQSFLDEQARLGRKVHVYRREKSKDFLRHLHSIINANNRGTQLDPDRARMALRQFVNFDVKQIASVTDFVRRFLLDEASIKLETFRNRYGIWRDLQKSIATTEEEIEAVAAILAQSERVMDYQFNARYWAYGQHRADYDLRLIHIHKKQADLIGLQDKLESTTSYLRTLNGNLEDARRRKDSLERQIEGSDASGDIRIARNKLADLEASERRAIQDLRSIHIGLSALYRAAIHPLLAPDFPELARFAQDRLTPAAIGPHDVSWPARPDSISSIVKELPAIGAVATAIEARRAEALTASHALGERRREADSKLASLRSGGTIIQPDTAAFIDELARMNIEAVSLSEVADIAAAHAPWRAITESLLGDWVYAVIVEPEFMDAAYDLFQSRFKKTRVKLIQTEMTDARDFGPRPGTFAEIIETENRHARAFINTRLGRRRRATNAQDIRKGETAAAMDGTSAQSRGIEHRRLDAMPKLGKSVRGEQERMLKEELASIAADEDVAGRKQKSLEALSSDLERARNRFANGGADAIATLDEAGTIRDGIETTKEEIDRLETLLPPEIVSELKDCKDDIKRLETEIPEEDRARDKAFVDAASCRAAIEHEQRSLVEARTNLLETLPSFQLRRPRVDIARSFGMEAFMTRARAAYRVEKINASSLNALKEGFRERIRTMKTNGRSPVSRLEQLIYNYVTAQPDQHPRFEWSLVIEREQTNAIHIWAGARLAHLEGTILRAYKIQIESARRTLVETMIQDFLSKLSDQLRSVEQTKDDLNKALKTNVFMGEVYQLRHERDQDKDDIRYLADRVDVIAPKALALIAGTLDENDPDHDRLRHFIDLLTTEEGGDDRQHMKRLEEIADYRNYYRFSIDICDPARDFARVSSLEQRKGTASGGQMYIPFYVCLGVAAAAAYRNHLGKSEKNPPQAGIVLLDEAFEKIDPENIEKIITFYKSLGLQLVLAAPKTHLALYQENFDTLVSILKVDRNLSVDIQHFRKAAHDMLREANPIHKPRDYFTNLITQEAASAAGQ